MRKLALFGTLLLGLALLAQAQAQRPRGGMMPMLKVDEIERFVRSARVEAPRHYEGLTIFPVVVDHPVRFMPLTMEEAMDRGWLSITEYAGGEVNRVYVTNKGDRPVFLMSGELIAGAKQDRTIAQDTLVAPNTRIALDVYCIEHGRWVQKSESFHAGKVAATPSIRMKAAAAAPGAAQSEVWADVRTLQSRTRTETSTGSLYESYQSDRIQRRIAPAKKALGRLPMEIEDANGVVVAIGGRILVADVFATPALFRKLWPELLDSYLMDSINQPRPVAEEKPEWGGASREQALRFLRTALGPRRERPTPGIGSLIELRGETTGTALVYRDAVAHLQLFPGVQMLRDEPLPHRTPSLEFRREQLQRGGG